MSKRERRIEEFESLAEEFNVNDMLKAELDVPGEDAQYAIVMESALEGDNALLIADTIESALAEAADGDMRQGTVIVDLNTKERYGIYVESMTAKKSPDGEVAGRWPAEAA